MSQHNNEAVERQSTERERQRENKGRIKNRRKHFFVARNMVALNLSASALKAHSHKVHLTHAIAVEGCGWKKFFHTAIFHLQLMDQMQLV